MITLIVIVIIAAIIIRFPAHVMMAVFFTALMIWGTIIGTCLIILSILNSIVSVFKK